MSMFRRLREVIRSRALIVLAAALCSLGAECDCNPCLEGEALEVTRYLASPATLQEVTIPANSGYYCLTQRNGWSHVGAALSNNGVRVYNSLEGPDGGPYAIIWDDVEDQLLTRWDLWIACGPTAGTIKAYRVDMTREQSVDVAAYREHPIVGSVMTLSGASKLTDETFKRDPAVSGLDKLGICVENTSSSPITLKRQFYVPDLVCAASSVPTPPQEGEESLPACSEPQPPPARRTCSNVAAQASAQNWGVPITSPINSCGDIGVYFANDLEEARGCARSVGFTTPSQVCEFEVLLYSNAGSVYVYKVAESQAAAVACARNTECPSCAPSVSRVGLCVTAAAR